MFWKYVIERPVFVLVDEEENFFSLIAENPASFLFKS